MLSHKRSNISLSPATPECGVPGYNHGQIFKMLKLGGPATIYNELDKIKVLTEAGFNLDQIREIADSQNGDDKITYILEEFDRLKCLSISCDEVFKILKSKHGGLRQLKERIFYLEKQSAAFVACQSLHSDYTNKLHSMGFTAKEIEEIAKLQDKNEFERFYGAYLYLISQKYPRKLILQLILYRLYTGNFSVLEYMKNSHEKLSALQFTPTQIIAIVKYDKLSKNIDSIISSPAFKILNLTPAELTQIASCVSGACNIDFLKKHASSLKLVGISNGELSSSLSGSRANCKAYRDSLLIKIKQCGNRDQKTSVAPKKEEKEYLESVEPIQLHCYDTIDSDDMTCAEENGIEIDSNPRLFYQSFETAFGEEESKCTTTSPLAVCVEHDRGMAISDEATFLSMVKTTMQCQASLFPVAYDKSTESFLDYCYAPKVAPVGFLEPGYFPLSGSYFSLFSPLNGSPAGSSFACLGLDVESVGSQTLNK